MVDKHDIEQTVEVHDQEEPWDAARAVEECKDALRKKEAAKIMEKEVERLSKLDKFAYEAERKEAAKLLGVRAGALDAEVDRRRGKDDEAKGMALCIDVEPHHEPQKLDVLLDDTLKEIDRFIICNPEIKTAVVLWVAFTWVIDHVNVAPLAIITAPELSCGKSQLLDIIGRLSRRSLLASNITPAATFRVIEAHEPTLLIDEADTFMRDNEELRGVINSGHTRTSAFVVRTVGDNHEVRRFSTWGAKAISGIGRLAPTIMSRGIEMQMRRKLKEEKIERLRHTSDAAFANLSARFSRFAKDFGRQIGLARPHLPEELTDRQQDNWEPLLAIAEAAGDRWLKKARLAAIKISGARDQSKSVGEQLLQSIHDIFEDSGLQKISREDLVRRLNEDEEAPWGTWNKGRNFTGNQLRSYLANYGVKTKKVRLSSYDTKQGFERKQFEDAWSRYLPKDAEPDADGDGTSASNEDEVEGGKNMSPPSTPPKNWNNGTAEQFRGSERSDAVPCSKPGLEQTDPVTASVPFQMEHRNAAGTLKTPENLACSDVPFSDPLPHGDTFDDIDEADL